MHNTLRLLQPIPLLQLTALLQAIQLVDILQPLMAGRAMATAQDHPTSCAKLSEPARLVTVAPTLSPMPNGKPLSGASGTAEFASSAIAFRRIDYWLKPPPRNASARSCLRASRTTREVRWRCFSAKWTSAPTRGRSARIFSATKKILRPRSRRRPSRYVDRIVYWALADVTREAPRLGPSTTTSAPIFTRL